jgi:hypothetical protein
MTLRSIWSPMAVRRARRPLIRATCALSLVFGVLAGCPSLLGGSPDSTGCSLADVHIGRNDDIYSFAGVAPSDFTIEKLACLGRSLMRERRLRSIIVFFFDSNEASERFEVLPWEGCCPGPVEAARRDHAEYSFDPDQKPEERLLIKPEGFLGEFSAVDLSGVAPHRCKIELELQNRCIMLAATSATYPQEALKMKASGTIMLTATIGRDGGIKDIRVADTHVAPDKARDFLVDAARQDLSTWRIDAADHDDPLRVTYSFVIDPSRPRGVEQIIRWTPPNQVEVRANVPE